MTLTKLGRIRPFCSIAGTGSINHNLKGRGPEKRLALGVAPLSNWPALLTPRYKIFVLLIYLPPLDDLLDGWSPGSFSPSPLNASRKIKWALNRNKSASIGRIGYLSASLFGVFHLPRLLNVPPRTKRDDKRCWWKETKFR